MLELGPSTISLLRLSLYKLLGFWPRTSGALTGLPGRSSFWMFYIFGASFLHIIFKESFEDFDWGVDG